MAAQGPKRQLFRTLSLLQCQLVFCSSKLGADGKLRWDNQKGRAWNVDGKIKLWQRFEKKGLPG